MTARKLLATLAIAAAALAPVAATAADYEIRYSEVSPSDAEARQIWTDELPGTPIGRYPAWVMSAHVTFDNGRVITVQQLWSGESCGSSQCPVRVWEGGRQIASFMACGNDASISKHMISDDARLITACGEVFRTNRR